MEMNNRTEVAKALSDMSRNTGKVTFKITYTATEGNVNIDKAFQDFCFKYSNNEYLAGLGMLLEVFDHYRDLKSLESYINLLEERLERVEDKLELNPVKELTEAKPEVKDEKKKTF